jgi:hypothetical protein
MVKSELLVLRDLAPANIQLVASVYVVDAATNTGVVGRGSTDQITRSRAGEDFKLPEGISVTSFHRKATEGWYYAIYEIAAAKQRDDGTYPPLTVLDGRRHLYKVGSPTTNIPYVEIQEVKPCSTTLPPGAPFTAVGRCSAYVKDSATPPGHRFSFEVVLEVIGPDGKVAAVKTETGSVSGGGPQSLDQKAWCTCQGL